MRKIWLFALLLTGCSAVKGSLLVNEATLAHPTSNIGRSVLVGEASNQTPGNGISGYGTVTAIIWHGQTGLMTAWHVVKGKGHYITVNGNGHRQVCGPFERVDNHDLGWLPMKLPPQWVPLRVAKPATNYGKCYTWGYPFVASTLTSYAGVDMGLARERDRSIRVIDGIAIPGQSGGPVVNLAGEVFAIVSESSSGRPVQGGVTGYRPHYPVTITD